MNRYKYTPAVCLQGQVPGYLFIYEWVLALGLA